LKTKSEGGIEPKPWNEKGVGRGDGNRHTDKTENRGPVPGLGTEARCVGRYGEEERQGQVPKTLKKKRGGDKGKGEGQTKRHKIFTEPSGPTLGSCRGESRGGRPRQPPLSHISTFRLKQFSRGKPYFIRENLTPHPK